MNDLRTVKRRNFEVARAECQHRGVALPRWPGDEEFSNSSLPPPLREEETRAVNAEPMQRRERPQLVLLRGGVAPSAR